jgi:hypothetical protein
LYPEFNKDKSMDYKTIGVGELIEVNSKKRGSDDK